MGDSWENSVQEVVVERIDPQLWWRLTVSRRRSNLSGVADAVENPGSVLRQELEAGDLGEENYLDWLLAQFLLRLLLPGFDQFTQLAVTLRLLDLVAVPSGRSSQFRRRVAAAALVEQFDDVPAEQIVTAALAQLEFGP